MANLIALPQEGKTHNQSFPFWLASIKDRAKHYPGCSHIVDHLLGSVLTPTQWAAIDAAHAATPFTLTPHPGAVPPATATQAVRDTWKMHNQLYVAEQDAISAFRVQIIATLVDNAADMIMDDTGLGNGNLSIQEMIAKLTAEYGGLTSGDLKAYLAKLDEPYDPTVPFLDFITDRNKIYRALLTDNFTLMEDQKVSSIILAVRGASRMFGDTCNKFREDFPNSSVLEGLRTHAELVTRLTNHHKAMQEDMASAVGYGNAVAPAPTSPEPAPAPANINTFTLEILAIIAATVEAVISRNDQERGNTRGGRKRRISTKYCWTHGYIGHTNKECHSRREGHVENATSHFGYQGASERFYEKGTRGARK